MNQPVISLQNVSRSFRTKAWDVSLEVPAGTVFALLGENGRKNYLIRILTGFQG